MKIHHYPANHLDFKNPVITTGSFDGVHLGHVYIINKLKELAKSVNGESVLITFDPHPRQVIHPEYHMKLLNSLEEKCKVLEGYGLDHLVVVPFSREFSEINALNYANDFLINQFQPKVIVIGYDHRFGKDREGDVALLKKLAGKSSIKIEEISKQMLEDLAISSTRIRNALIDGDIELANSLLGYTYSLSGIVVKGDQIGRQLGYPTANIRVKGDGKLIPGDGIYAVKAFRGNEELKAVCSIGKRPTFDGSDRRVEVHIFNFDEDIYGEDLRVEFISFIRGEKKFNNTDELIEAMNHDSKKALEILHQR